MEEPMLIHPTSAADMDNGLKDKRCSKITWVHLSRYYTHLLNLRHISTQPSTVQQYTCPKLIVIWFLTFYIHISSSFLLASDVWM